MEKHHHNLVEKSNQLYNELLEKQIIPALQREDEEQLSMEELTQIAEKLEEVVEDYTQKSIVRMMSGCGNSCVVNEKRQSNC